MKQLSVNYALQRGLSLARVSSWIHSGGEGLPPTIDDYVLLGVGLSDEAVADFNASLSAATKIVDAPILAQTSNSGHADAALFEQWAKKSTVGQTLYDRRSLSLAKIAAFASSVEIPLDPSLIPSESDYQNAGIHGLFDYVDGLSLSIGQVNAALRSLPETARIGLTSMAAAVGGVPAGQDGLHPVFGHHAPVNAQHDTPASSHAMSEMPSIPSVIPAIPKDFPAIPSVLPSIPKDFPAIPSVLPAIPHEIPGIPGMNKAEGQHSAQFGGLAHEDNSVHPSSGMPPIPSVLPAIPTEIPAIPSVIPAIPKDIPGIPSVLPAIPHEIPGIPGMHLAEGEHASQFAGLGHVDYSVHPSGGMPPIPSVLPAIPSEIPAIPSVLPAIPKDIPAIPSVLPAIPHDMPGIPGMLSMHSVHSLNAGTSGSSVGAPPKLDLMSLLGSGRHVLVAHVDGMSYPIFTDKGSDESAPSVGMPDQTAIPGDVGVHAGNFQNPYEQDSWRYNFG